MDKHKQELKPQHPIIRFRTAITKIFILLGLLFCFELDAQIEEVLIRDIQISGNDRTKEFVITNEMNLEKGSVIPKASIDELLEQNRAFILSTGLFNDANLFLINWEGSEADLMIELEENWYIFPSPIFELADRNFTQWWREQGRSLDRINLGVRLSHYNLTGSKDPLRLKFQFGYTRKLEADYIFPYLNKERTLGLGASVFYSDNREIGFATLNNKTQFAQAPDERLLLKRFRTGIRLTYRPDRQFHHSFRLEYHRNAVDPFVRDSLNRNYFLNDRTSIQFFFAEYDVQLDNRDYSIYPQKGFLLFGNFKKEGFGIFNEFDNLSVTIGGEHYTPIGSRVVLANRVKGKTNLTRQQISFANNTGLGWTEDDTVTGFDLFVVDGTDYFISTNSLRAKVFDSNVNLPSWMPKQLERINLKLFLRFNYDFAYVNERDYTDTNTINNRLFAGYGPALDIILFNNFLFSFEYSYNDLGEKGLFINSRNSF